MARLETPGARLKLPGVSAAPRRLDPAQLNGYRELRLIEAAAAELGIADPFFRAHDGIAGAETTIDDRRIGNFASYDYLALNGDPRITGAAKAAIDRYGTSVSASRMVSGERPIHHHREAARSDADGAITLVSGHAQRLAVGALLGPGDIIVHDAFVHTSIFEGARRRARAGCRSAIRRCGCRPDTRRARRGTASAIVIEGHYSMDGDVPDLAAFVALARRHDAWLMVDEACAGCLVAGFGLAEHAGIDPREVVLDGHPEQSLVSTGGTRWKAELIGY